MEEKIDKLEKIKEENIKKLVKEVIENPEEYRAESKYLLVVTTLTRNRGDFPHWRKMQVIQGNPEVIKLDNYTEYDDEYDVMLIIPRRLGTIIRVFEYERISEEETQEVEEYYIFTRNGWVMIRAK